MSDKPFDAEAVLAKLAEIRKSLPIGDRPPSRKDGVVNVKAQTLEDFEQAAVVDALESMADDLQAALDDAMDAAYEQALDAYYAAEELAKKPEHADLVAHVENMRAAHQQSYGRPVPSREETETRRCRKTRK